MHCTTIIALLGVYLPKDLPDRICVLASGSCGGVQRLCWAAYIIDTDRAIIGAHCQQVWMLRVKV